MSDQQNDQRRYVQAQITIPELAQVLGLAPWQRIVSVNHNPATDVVSVVIEDTSAQPIPVGSEPPIVSLSFREVDHG